jgi:hypothetical protein
MEIYPEPFSLDTRIYAGGYRINLKSMTFYEILVTNFRSTYPKLEALGRLGKTKSPQRLTCPNLKGHINFRLRERELELFTYIYSTIAMH